MKTFVILVEIQLQGLNSIISVIISSSLHVR